MIDLDIERNLTRGGWSEPVTRVNFRQDEYRLYSLLTGVLRDLYHVSNVQMYNPDTGGHFVIFETRFEEDVARALDSVRDAALTLGANISRSE